MIEEIAKTGYDGIEIGVHRFENTDNPEAFRDLVKSHGLQVTSIHTLGELYHEDVLAGKMDYPLKAADFTQAVESKFMLVSGDPKEGKTLADYQAMAEVLNQVGQICRQRGITLCYHNHWWEIVNDQEGLKTICENTDPGIVSLCIDVGWVERAGASPVDIVSQYLERTPYFHFKDTIDGKFIEPGAGTVDFAGVLKLLREDGACYLAVERDEVLPNAFESARISREHLRTLGV
jgi:sugar phosphate isomerase/epimerase